MMAAESRTVRSVVRTIEDGVANDAIARQVMSAIDDFCDFRDRSLPRWRSPRGQRPRRYRVARGDHDGTARGRGEPTRL